MDVSELQFAERFNGVSGSAIREIFKLMAGCPDMISVPMPMNMMSAEMMMEFL